MQHQGIAEFTIGFHAADPHQWERFATIYALLQAMKRQEFPAPDASMLVESEAETLDIELARAIEASPDPTGLAHIVERMEEAEYILHDPVKDGATCDLTFEILGYPFGAYQPILDLLRVHRFEIVRDDYDQWKGKSEQKPPG